MCEHCSTFSDKATQYTITLSDTHYLFSSSTFNGTTLASTIVSPSGSEEEGEARGIYLVAFCERTTRSLLNTTHWTFKCFLCSISGTQSVLEKCFIQSLTGEEHGIRVSPTQEVFSCFCLFFYQRHYR